MIEKIIDWSVEYRFMVLMLAFILNATHVANAWRCKDGSIPGLPDRLNPSKKVCQQRQPVQANKGD